MTAVEVEAPARRTWSVSAAKSYDARDGGCPRQWSYRYGPHRAEEAREHIVSGGDFDVPRRVGKILHAAIQAAMEAARADTRPPAAGTPLRRYWAAARAALGKAWDAEGMPSDSVLAGQVMEMFEHALDDIALPGAGAIYSIESKQDVIGPRGTPITFVADYAYWRAPGVLRVVDWKSGTVEGKDVRDNWQLLVYAALILLADPSVRFVEIELYSLRQRRGFVHRVTAEEARRALSRLENVAARADADDECTPRPGPHCVSCRFRSICPDSAVPPTASPITLSANPPTGRNTSVSSDVSDREVTR